MNEPYVNRRHFAKRVKIVSGDDSGFQLSPGALKRGDKPRDAGLRNALDARVRRESKSILNNVRVASRDSRNRRASDSGKIASDEVDVDRKRTRKRSLKRYAHRGIRRGWRIDAFNLSNVAFAVS